MACAGRGALIRTPPQTLPPPLDLERFSVTSPKVEDGYNFGDCEYDSWFWTATVLCTSFRRSDRTLRSRDIILEFLQEIVKICAEIWTPAWILACPAGTTSQYSTGETPPIKAERLGLWDHLGCFSFHPSVSSPFHHSSSVIYSMFIDMKSCFHHYIPVAFIIIIHLIITTLCVRSCIIHVNYLFSNGE